MTKIRIDVYPGADVDPQMQVKKPVRQISITRASYKLCRLAADKLMGSKYPGFDFATTII